MNKLTLLGILSISIFTMAILAGGESLESETYPKEIEKTEIKSPKSFVIEGLVENPLNLTYADLRSFPLLSEVTTLECIGSGRPPYGPEVTYNWTGVPLFHLLNMAKIISGGYREVVFNASDGFSSSVSLEIAMDPTSILALEANGTDLEELSGLGSGYRVAFPCRWGYKWVKWVKQIIIVDYDYKGTYEQYGLSDEAIRPNCTMPQTDPPFLAFNVTKIEEYTVKVLSNSSIESFDFKYNNQLVFNFTGKENSTEYFYAIFPKNLLSEPYQIYVNDYVTNYSQSNYGDDTYLYFTFNYSTGTITITGATATIGGGGGSRKPLLK